MSETVSNKKDPKCWWRYNSQGGRYKTCNYLQEGSNYKRIVRGPKITPEQYTEQEGVDYSDMTKAQVNEYHRLDMIQRRKSKKSSPRAKKPSPKPKKPSPKKKKKKDPRLNLTKEEAKKLKAEMRSGMTKKEREKDDAQEALMEKNERDSKKQREDRIAKEDKKIRDEMRLSIAKDTYARRVGYAVWNRGERSDAIHMTKLKKLMDEGKI